MVAAAMPRSAKPRAIRTTLGSARLWPVNPPPGITITTGRSAAGAPAGRYRSRRSGALASAGSCTCPRPYSTPGSTVTRAGRSMRSGSGVAGGDEAGEVDQLVAGFGGDVGGFDRVDGAAGEAVDALLDAVEGPGVDQH